MHIICAPPSALPGELRNFIPYSLYSSPPSPEVGIAGLSLPQVVRRRGLVPTEKAWDLMSIALGVVAADDTCSRGRSSDGWTRHIGVSIAVSDPVFWTSQTTLLKNMLQFLTGDLWEIFFLEGGVIPPGPRQISEENAETVCLLSGGMDSLVGAVDLVSDGQRPLFVSQSARGDKQTQQQFARAIRDNSHLQFRHPTRRPRQSPHKLGEMSQRARSFAFIAEGVLVATALSPIHDGGTVNLYVPENGFISLNIPLTPLRIGSLSTRTTHPLFLRLFQNLLGESGIRVQLINPYKFKTKGEMLRECSNQEMLHDLVSYSTSCGRYARMGFNHCGRCVPCLIRRAAFQSAGVNDLTNYLYEDLSIPDQKHRDFEDVRSALWALEKVRSGGLDSWIGGYLSLGQMEDVERHKQVVQHGIEELRIFLHHVGAA